MERITNENHRELGFFTYSGKLNPYSMPLTIGELAGTICKDYSPKKILEEVFARLAAYEDTGLTPEEVTALQMSSKALKEEAIPLLRAKIEGRLVVLPCKVTDTVYVLEPVFNGERMDSVQIVSAQIDHVTIGGTTGKPVFDLCSEKSGWHYSLEPGQFFLKREIAEAVLRQQKGVIDNE